MTEKATSPLRPTDDEARALARALLDGAGFAALGSLREGGGPMVTRVALACDARGAPVTLVSDLSAHTRALRADPRCALLVGEPGAKGDPLTHPRLSLEAEAEFVPRAVDAHGQLRALWLARHPKAGLYVDFADFGFVRLMVTGADLNGGFGRAYRLSAVDLGL